MRQRGGAWEAFKFIDLKQAKLQLQNHKAQGNKINVILIQAHGADGIMAIGAGKDGKVNTEAVAVGDRFYTDDQPLTSYRLESYMGDIKRIKGIENKQDREKEITDFKELDGTIMVEEFLGVVNELEDGGTLILNGCHVFNGEDGLKLSNAILEITGKRVNVIGSQDYSGDLPSNVNAKDRIFSDGLIHKVDQNKGYMKNSQSTGKNLKLNGSGDKPFEFIPLNKTTEQKKP